MDSICLLEEQDIPAVLDIIRENYPDEDLRESALADVRAMFAQETWIRPTFLVIKAADKIVAFGAYSTLGLDYDGYGIYWVNVSPAWQGKGYGTRLIQALLERIRAEPSRCSYAVLSCQYSLRAFYEACGFTVLKDRGTAGVEKYLMQIELRVDKVHPLTV